MAMADLNASVDEFVGKLQRREPLDALFCAKRTAELLRQVIFCQRLSSSGQASVLLDAVRTVGTKLISANRTELVIGNIVRRVMKIIREEEAVLTDSGSGEGGASGTSGRSDIEENTSPGDGQRDNLGDSNPAYAAAAAVRSILRAPSLRYLLEPNRESDTLVGDPESKQYGVQQSKQLKHNVIEGVNELIEEVNDSSFQIAQQALEHIHQNEVILTLGRSETLLKFLLEAKKKRSFQVLVAEGAPRYAGQTLAKELSSAGLQTTLITDSAIFPMMARANMVLIGADAVVANGGVVAPVGSHIVALAAERHAVPFVALTGLHKLCPIYPHDPDTMLNEMKLASEILDYGEFSDCMENDNGEPLLQVLNPAFDYIPPELISLFITDSGGHNPSYVYRLLLEYYSLEDYVL